MKRPGIIGLATAFGLVVAAALAGPASAGDRPLGVVELFTSQGCNSCPPADKVLGDLAGRGDVVALSYHVDYWDYLGWRDTMASPENTGRQREYGRALAQSSVYTPEAVINGRTHVNGAHGDAVAATLDRLDEDGKGLGVDVSLERKGDSLIIETGDAPAGKAREAHLVLVYFDPAKPVVIKRGENSGKTITYWNAVTDFQTAGMWHGQAKRFELPLSEVEKQGGGCAVLLQAVTDTGLPGPILGAAVMTRPAA